jgi:pimeloyl-ACP methyl ester carboxylesterase
MFMRRIRGKIHVPLLQVQGTDDRCVLAGATTGSGSYVPDDYRYVRVDGAGHFLTEEAPNAVNRILIDWLDSLSV